MSAQLGNPTWAISNVCSIKLKKIMKNQEATNLHCQFRLLEMGAIHKFQYNLLVP